jgi:hypothetical protein
MAHHRFLPAVLLLSVCSLSCVGMSPADRHLFWDLERGGSHPQSESFCHVHHVRLEMRQVPVEDGFCVADRVYARARLRLFPNSFLYILSCFCEPFAPRDQEHLVCPLCRAAEERWVNRHQRWFFWSFDRL